MTFNLDVVSSNAFVNDIQFGCGVWDFVRANVVLQLVDLHLIEDKGGVVQDTVYKYGIQRSRKSARKLVKHKEYDIRYNK